MVDSDAVEGGIRSFVTGASSLVFSFVLPFFAVVVVTAGFSFLGFACVAGVVLKDLLFSSETVVLSAEGSVCRAGCEIVDRHRRHVNVLCNLRCQDLSRNNW